MGTDNLFHKRRERRARELMRIQKIRASYDFILILCEGKKTEPNYFKSLRSHLHLNKELIVIHEGFRGNDPLSLVNSAEEEFDKELKRDPEKRGYDNVFVVFDRDTHTTYTGALQKITGLSKKHKEKFKAIVSIPCFELWLLQHFEDVTRPYAASSSNSICDNVIHDLKVHIPDYEKGSRTAFELTHPMLDVAISRAQSLERRHEGVGTGNPSTKVHQLVKYLQGIKRQ